MALINCKNCGHVISDKALKCPQCGLRMSRKNLSKTEIPKEVDNRKSDPACLTGFIFGILSIFLGGWSTYVPMFAMLMSFGGLKNFDEEKYKHKWQGNVGLVLGLFFWVVYRALNKR